MTPRCRWGHRVSVGAFQVRSALVQTLSSCLSSVLFILRIARFATDGMCSCSVVRFTDCSVEVLVCCAIVVVALQMEVGPLFSSCRLQNIAACPRMLQCCHCRRVFKVCLSSCDRLDFQSGMSHCGTGSLIVKSDEKMSVGRFKRVYQ